METGSLRNAKKWNIFPLQLRQFVWEMYSTGILFSQVVAVFLRNATERNAFPLIRQHIFRENQWSRTLSVGMEEHCLTKQIVQDSIFQRVKQLHGESFKRNKVKVCLKTARDDHERKRKSVPNVVFVLTETAQSMIKRGRSERSFNLPLPLTKLSPVITVFLSKKGWCPFEIKIF